mmetsp:Transcript_80413/g.239567  ORF Transcript_80413/g.239567 Transcript_80413/m.239567 type:complete len:315 (+) Transcript_80413:67-1011(+)
MASLSRRVSLVLATGVSCLRLDDYRGADVSGRSLWSWTVFPKPTGTTYVWIAGVPGTGQEYWKVVLRECVNTGPCQLRENRFYAGLFFEEVGLLNETWPMPSKTRAIQGLVPMNLVSPDTERHPDEAYFRAFSRNLAGLADPHLPLYSQLAKSNGDNFKAIVLTTASEKDLTAYASTTLGMDPEKAEDLLVADISALAEQVRALPADAFRCMRLEDTLDLDGSLAPLLEMTTLQAKAFAEGLRANVTSPLHGCVTIGEGRGRKKQVCPDAREAPKLRAALDMLEGLCDPKDFIKAKSSDGLTVASTKKIEWLVE